MNECKHEWKDKNCIHCGMLTGARGLPGYVFPIESAAPAEYKNKAERSQGHLDEFADSLDKEFDKFWGDRIIGYPAGNKRVFVDSPNMEMELPRLKNFIRHAYEMGEAKGIRQGEDKAREKVRPVVLEIRQATVKEILEMIPDETLYSDVLKQSIIKKYL